MNSRPIEESIYYYKNRYLELSRFAMFYEPRQENYEFLYDTFNPAIASKIDAIYKGEQECFMWDGIEDPEEKMGILSQRTVLYVFFKIISDKRQKAVIKSMFTGPCKLWLNNKLVGAANGIFNETLIYEVQEGENLIVFESTGFDEAKGMSFCVKNYEKEMKQKYSSLLYKTYQFAKEEVRLVDDGDDPDKNRKRIFVFPRDINRLEMDQDVTVKITDCIDNLLLDTFQCKFYDIFEIDGSKYSGRISYRKLNGIKITAFYYHKNKSQYSVSNYLITKNPQAQIKAVGDKAYEMIADGFVPTKSVPYFQRHLEYTQRDYMAHNWRHFFQSALRLQTYITLLEENRKADLSKVTSDGTIDKIYFSKLDGKPERILYTLPKNYNENKKYPLFITIAPHDMGDNCILLQKYTKEDVIFADISSKGLTKGCYIGEAALLEAMDLLKDSLSVDVNRIYLSGFSQGATSVWNLVQKYPHLFAGFIPIAGTADYRFTNNLSNMAALGFFEWEKSTENLYFRNLNRCLSRNKHIVKVPVSGLSRPNLVNFLAKEDSLDYILQFQREPYPNELSYTTRTNRHNRAYWISEIEITKNKEFCRIKAAVVSNEIHIHTINCSGFCIEIPPQMDKTSIPVYINNVLVAQAENQNDIFFQKSSRGWKQISSQCSNTDRRKGTGLLDIFHYPITIVIPENADSFTKKSAEIFSSPVTNGVHPEIAIKYDIITQEAVTQDILQNRGLILFDDLSSDLSIYKEIRKNAPVKYSAKGYSYQGVHQEGEYVIMQILDSPYNENLPILLISYNNSKLLRENIFTRKLIIPSDNHRIHPYLNSEVLIYDNHKFFDIYEKEAELLEIK